MRTPSVSHGAVVPASGPTTTMSVSLLKKARYSLCRLCEASIVSGHRVTVLASGRAARFGLRHSPSSLLDVVFLRRTGADTA